MPVRLQHELLCTLWLYTAHCPDRDTFYWHLSDLRAWIQSACVEIWKVIQLCSTSRCHLSQPVARPRSPCATSLWAVSDHGWFSSSYADVFIIEVFWFICQCAANYSRVIITSPVGLIPHTHSKPPTQLWQNPINNLQCDPPNPQFVLHVLFLHCRLHCVAPVLYGRTSHFGAVMLFPSFLSLCAHTQVLLASVQSPGNSGMCISVAVEMWKSE